MGSRERVQEARTNSVPAAEKSHGAAASSKNKKGKKEASTVKVETPAASKGASAPPVRDEIAAASKDSSPPKATETSNAASANSKKKGSPVTQGTRNESNAAAAQGPRNEGNVAAARTVENVASARAAEEWNLAGSKTAKSKVEKKQPVSASMAAAAHDTEANVHDQGNALIDKDRANPNAAMESVRLQRARIHEQLQHRQDFAAGARTAASAAAVGASADTVKPTRSGVRASAHAFQMPPALQRDPMNPWNVSKAASLPENSVDPDREYSLDDHSHALLQNVVEMCVGSSSHRPTLRDQGMDMSSKPAYKPPALQQHNSQDWSATWSSAGTTQASQQGQDFAFECIMCMDEESEIVVVPCGHLMWCQKCANSNMEYLLCAQR